MLFFPQCCVAFFCVCACRQPLRVNGAILFSSPRVPHNTDSHAQPSASERGAFENQQVMNVAAIFFDSYCVLGTG